MWGVSVWEGREPLSPCSPSLNSMSWLCRTLCCLQGHQLSLHWEPLPIHILLHPFSVPSYFCIFCSYLTLRLFWDTWFSKVELGTLLLCFRGTLCTFTITMVCTHWHYYRLSTCLSLSVGLWAPQGRASTVLLSYHICLLHRWAVRRHSVNVCGMNSEWMNERIIQLWLEWCLW